VSAPDPLATRRRPARSSPRRERGVVTSRPGHMQEKHRIRVSSAALPNSAERLPPRFQLPPWRVGSEVNQRYRRLHGRRLPRYETRRVGGVVMQCEKAVYLMPGNGQHELQVVNRGCADAAQPAPDRDVWTPRSRETLRCHRSP
jgi:hypothetical protein